MTAYDDGRHHIWLDLKDQSVILTGEPVAYNLTRPKTNTRRPGGRHPAGPPGASPWHTHALRAGRG